MEEQPSQLRGADGLYLGQAVAANKSCIPHCMVLCLPPGTKEISEGCVSAPPCCFLGLEQYSQHGLVFLALPKPWQLNYPCFPLLSLVHGGHSMDKY